VAKAAALLNDTKAIFCASTDTLAHAAASSEACPLEISTLLLQAEIDLHQHRKPAVLAMLASSSHLLPADHLLKYLPIINTRSFARQGC
jgi:hypothetical protein